MLSRVAEAVYWMSRYVERAENTARFIDVNLHLMLDLPGRESPQWDPLVTTTGDLTRYKELYDTFSEENVIRFLTFDTNYSNSILSCLRNARENGRSIREIISSEMWEQVNSLYLMVKEAAVEDREHSTPHEFFRHIKMSKHLLTGLAEEVMSHGEGWQFFRLGMMLERADKTSRILDVKYFILLPRLDYAGTPYDNIEWAAVLKSASALEMYRKRFHRIAPVNVAEFLIFDPIFPRSIRFCVTGAEQSLHTIAGTPIGAFSNTAERRIGRIKAELDYGDMTEVFGQGLHEYIDALQTKLNDVGIAVGETFFGYGIQENGSETPPPARSRQSQTTSE